MTLLFTLNIHLPDVTNAPTWMYLQASTWLYRTNSLHIFYSQLFSTLHQIHILEEEQAKKDVVYARMFSTLHLFYILEEA